VLDDVGEHDRVVASAGRGGLLQRGLVDVEPEHIPRVARGGAGQLEPCHLVAAPARFVEQQAVAAADVEQPARRDVPPDQVQQPPRGRAPAGLLVQIGLVPHVTVEGVQVGARRQARLLDGAAVHAREQVTVLAGPVVAGREVGRRRRSATAGVAELEGAVADPAGDRVHGSGQPILTAT
jgi:hypothetical protein